jgi:predicted lipid-binding transport protein (Tim44 family)
MSTFRKIFAGTTTLLAVILSFALIVHDADARRLGGGKSFGRQSPNVNRQQSAPPQKTPAQDAAAKPAQPQTPPAAGNRWLAPLAGIAAGLGIAALLSHFGLAGPFASALGSMLVIALLVFGAFFIWRMLRGPRHAVANDAPMRQAFETPVAGNRSTGTATNVFGAPMPGTRESAESPSWNVPADFDVQGFLRSAKVYFNRLQAAWDAKDLDDIRRFTTPEAFAEIKMQRDEGAGQSDRTEINNLDAVLLGIETTPAEYVASVRFTGTIRENGGNLESFEEIWNLAKPVDGRSGWLLAGVQQVH